MGEKRRAAAIAAITVGLVGLGVPQVAAESERPIVLTKGHIDLFELTYDGDTEALSLKVKDDSELYGEGSLFHDPNDVTIAVDEELAELVIPEGLPEAYDFLGEPGAIVYDLPMTQNEDLPWPGWSTERLVGSLPSGIEVPTTADAVKFSVDVEGPGDLHTFMVDSVGMPIGHYVDTTDGGPDVIPASRNQHAHTEWVFTELGDYLLTVTPSAETTTGALLTGPAKEYHIRVGDGPAVGDVATETKVSVTGAPQVYAAKSPAVARIAVTTADGDAATGTVDVSVGDRRIADDRGLTNGVARVTLPRNLKPGTHAVRASFTATTAGQLASQSGPIKVRVTKAPAAVATKLSVQRITVSKRARLSVAVTLPKSAGVTASGKVTVRDGRRSIATGTLRKGRVAITLPRLRKGRHPITVRYPGTSLYAAAVSPKRTLVVTR